MPALQYWFTGTALVACLAFFTGSVTLAGLGYGWYRAAVGEVSSVSQRQQTEEVKRLLGRAILVGNGLIGRMRQLTQEEAKKQAEAWAQRTHDVIMTAYGEGEAALFRNDSGYTFYSSDHPTDQVRNWVDGRMRRLTELMPRTDTLRVQSGFDPKKHSWPE